MNKITQAVYIANEIDSVEKNVKILFERLGGIQQWISPGARILIKPNFVAPFKTVVTDFDIIRAVVKEIKSKGGLPVIAESSGYEFSTEETFRLLGTYDLAKELDVDLMNLDNHPYRKISVKNGLIRNFYISEVAFTVDSIINLPRLKKHSQTDITCGMKNLFGLLSRKTRAKIHAVNLDRGIADLNRIIKPVLTIVDASRVLERAVFGKEKNGKWEESKGIIAGQDVLAVDRFCCELLEIDFESIGHILIASKSRLSRIESEVVNSNRKKNDKLNTPQTATKNKIHRLAYRLIFVLEIILSHLIGIRSIVPYFHYYFGIRPKINPNLCNQCGDCADVCPINVIDLKKKKILKHCMYLRCLRCYKECNLNAIELIGRKTLDSPLEETAIK